MELDRALLREAMGNEEFVQGIPQRPHAFGGSGFLAHLDRCLAESSIHQQPLIGGISEDGSGEIEAKSGIVFVKPPERTRVEELGRGCWSEGRYSIDLNLDV